MVIKTLYRYTREDGGVTVSTEKPNGEYTETLRLIADEGKLITQNGIDLYPVKDADTIDGWYEVDEPIEADEEEE